MGANGEGAAVVWDFLAFSQRKCISFFNILNNAHVHFWNLQDQLLFFSLYKFRMNCSGGDFTIIFKLNARDSRLVAVVTA
jgi:hypothetical protein